MPCEKVNRNWRLTVDCLLFNSIQSDSSSLCDYNWTITNIEGTCFLLDIANIFATLQVTEDEDYFAFGKISIIVLGKDSIILHWVYQGLG